MKYVYIVVISLLRVLYICSNIYIHTNLKGYDIA